LHFFREFEDEPHFAIDEILKLRINHERGVTKAGELTVQNDIGVRLKRTGGICYLIAAVQIFYHIYHLLDIKEIRRRIG
jgi:hypothetical protein